MQIGMSSPHTYLRRVLFEWWKKGRRKGCSDRNGKGGGKSGYELVCLDNSSIESSLSHPYLLGAVARILVLIPRDPREREGSVI